MQTLLVEQAAPIALEGVLTVLGTFAVGAVRMVVSLPLESDAVEPEEAVLTMMAQDFLNGGLI